MIHDTYRTPAGMSDAGRHAAAIDSLPCDVAALARVVQGLMIHEHIAPVYGVALSAEQHAQAHLRSVDQILTSLTARDPRPLSTARLPAERQVGVCRHFTLLHVAMLRRHGVAARARCGFGAYFEKGKFLDHWVSEYWHETRQAWVLADAQLDDRQRGLFKIGFDPLDVPRDQFLVAGDAWHLARTGKADPQAFGILDMHGLWFIAGNVVRDLAALNSREMLPWDVWGAMPRTDGELDLAFIDRLAPLSAEPETHFGELRALAKDPRLAVPGTVFNAVLNRPDDLSEAA